MGTCCFDIPPRALSTIEFRYDACIAGTVGAESTHVDERIYVTHWYTFRVFFVMATSYYRNTCVRQPSLKLTSVIDMERWLSYKGTCHVILLAKLHDMYLYKTDNFFDINHYLKSVSKVAVLHRLYCMWYVSKKKLEIPFTS